MGDAHKALKVLDFLPQGYSRDQIEKYRACLLESPLVMVEELASSESNNLPCGVRLISLHSHLDDRGDFTEMFRQSDVPEVKAVQWNVVFSRPNVFRGIHIHLRHWDYLVLASGSCEFGLIDCRPHSPTWGCRSLLRASGRTPYALVIPPGVAHGFLFLEESLHVYAVSEYWDGSDELGVNFRDPACALPWSLPNPILSERDQALPSMMDLQRSIPPSMSVE